MNPDKLLALSAAATPPDWVVDDTTPELVARLVEGVYEYIAHTDSPIWDNINDRAEVNAALIVYLRNHAAAMAREIAAGRAMRDAIIAQNAADLDREHAYMHRHGPGHEEIWNLEAAKASEALVVKIQAVGAYDAARAESEKVE